MSLLLLLSIFNSSAGLSSAKSGKRKEFEQADCYYKADVYSFGISMYEIYTGKIAYQELELPAAQIILKVVNEVGIDRFPSSNT